MSNFFNLFRGKPAQGQTPDQIKEDDVLAGEGDHDNHRLTHMLESLLRQVITIVAPAKSVMAEVLVAIPNTSEIFTVVIQPTTSVALYMCLREGEGITGEVFQKGQPVATNVSLETQATTEDRSQNIRAHLYSTRSALAVPLKHGGATIGVMNVECPQPDALNQQSLSVLLASGLVERIAGALAEIHLEAIDQQAIVESLLDRLEQRIAVATNQQDRLDIYHQILQIARQVVRPTDVSGALILVRKVAQNTLSQEGKTVNYAIHAARIGAFGSDLEWNLEAPGQRGNRNSITRRILDNSRGEIIPNAKVDPDYRDSGAATGDSSELIAPLMDGARAIGVICLVAPRLNTFSEEDLHAIQVVAQITVHAIKQSEEIAISRRQSEQQEFSDQLLKTLADLFPYDMRQLSMKHIAEARERVSNLILNAATQKTRSQHGAFLLVERTDDQQRAEEQPSAYLIMQEHTPGMIDQAAPKRRRAGDGISGRAYGSGRTISAQDVKGDPDYVPFFKDARSEVAAPMKIGDTTLGVLDVESDEVEHFTNDDILWIEFLALQAAFALTTIDRAVKTHIEITLAELSRKIDDDIAKMQALSDLSEVRRQRRELARAVIESLRDLTGSEVGRYFLALNAYKNDHVTPDEERGQLSYLISTDPSDENSHRFFSLKYGVSSRAFKERRQIVFNDRATRDEKYPEYFATSERNSPSGIYLPVLEGAQVAGVLSIESAHEGAFAPEMIHACELAGALVSKIVTAARLSIVALLREKLRVFDAEILRMQTADMGEFMRDALTKAAELSSIEEGWGRVVLLRQPADGKTPLLTDQHYAMEFTADGGQFRVLQELDEGDSQDRSGEIIYPIFREAILQPTRGPVLILDRDLQNQAEKRGEPWPAEAHSVICVPLFRPGDDNGSLEAIGVLALAHPNKAEFSEYDKQILTQFAETIVDGLKNIALLQARKNLLRQVRHDFSLAIYPLTLDGDTGRRRIDQALSADDIETARKQIAGVREVNVRIEQLMSLLEDLMNWFFDLSDEDLQLERDPSLRIDLGGLVKMETQRLDALAKALRKKTAVCIVPDQEIYIQGGDVRTRLIRAALFQYMDNAIKYGEDTDIRIVVSQENSKALITVISVGETVPKEEWDRLYGLYYRGSNATGDYTGSGIGLFQVKNIATRLRGEAYYRAEPEKRINKFILALPIVDTTSATER